MIRRFELRAAAIPRAGSQVVSYKVLSVSGPSTIRITEPDRELASELQRLLAGARDVEIGRRDRGWRPEPISVVVDGVAYEQCLLDRPFNPYGTIESVEFRIRHGEL